MSWSRKGAVYVLTCECLSLGATLAYCCRYHRSYKGVPYLRIPAAQFQPLERRQDSCRTHTETTAYRPGRSKNVVCFTCRRLLYSASCFSLVRAPSSLGIGPARSSTAETRGSKKRMGEIETSRLSIAPTSVACLVRMCKQAHS